MIEADREAAPASRARTRLPRAAGGGAGRRTLLVAAPWAALVLLWQLVALSGLVNAALIPTPAQVVERFWRLLTQDTLALDIAMSTGRVTLGVALGIVCAVPVGFLLGWYRAVRSFIDPVIN